MRTVLLIVATILITIVLVSGIGVVLWIKFRPLNYLLATTSVSRIEITNKTLGSVTQDFVDQVNSRKGTTIKVLFCPESLANNTREGSGGVFGNPPVEGNADDALNILAADYRCSYAYVNENTILFYRSEND